MHRTSALKRAGDPKLETDEHWWKVHREVIFKIFLKIFLHVEKELPFQMEENKNEEKLRSKNCPALLNVRAN